MILAGGILSEPPLAMLLERLEALGAPVVIFDQRAFAESRLRWRLSGGCVEGTLTIGERQVDLSEVDAVFLRLMDYRLLPEVEDAPEDSAPMRQARALHDGLVAWSDIAPGQVVNRYRDMGSNGSKPYQAQRIRRHGFAIPETLITNDPALVRAFAREHGRIVYKSISGVRSIVSEFHPEDVGRLDALRACPVQFQALVPGFDVRVHTIGAAAIATRIDSPGTDYRYADHGGEGTSLSAFDLPDEVADRCCRLAADLGLAFAGIDLRFGPAGTVFCFEVNPSPAYSYYEANTGQPIAETLARYLAGDR